MGMTLYDHVAALPGGLRALAQARLRQEVLSAIWSASDGETRRSRWAQKILASDDSGKVRINDLAGYLFDRGCELQVTLVPAGAPRAETEDACTTAYTAAVVREASPEEGAALFDKVALRLFKVSGAEWLERYDAGDYRDSHDPRVSSLELLIPFVRSVPA